MKIALIVPMAEEAEFYRHNFPRGKNEMFGPTAFEHFFVGENEIYLGLSGIGKVNAAMNLTALLSCVSIDCVFMTGSAGAMQNTLRQGDIILVNRFCYHDAHNTAAGDYVEGQIPQEPARYVLDSAVRNDFKHYLERRHVAFKEGLVVTGDSFIASQKQKDAIAGNFPQALGVEMEGAAFAQVAYHFKKPLLALRAISDNGDGRAGEDFTHFVKEVGAKVAKLLCDYLKGEEE